MDRLPSEVHRRISEKILTLEDNPRPSGSQKLRGEENYRLRVGDYRVLYTIDDKARRVLVYGVAHRREAYR
jgi:mRNA interferase RelE/StbE